MRTIGLLLSALALVGFFAWPALAQNTAKASMSEVVEAAMQPLEADPVVVYKASSLSTIEALAASVGADFRSVRYAQDVVIKNFHSTISVCVFSVAAGTACTTDADASCRGGADPKPVVGPGESRKFRFAGTRDACAITSAIAGEWQSETTLRKVGAR